MLDRRVIGKHYPAAWNEVEKGAIRRFAEAIGDLNPLHLDEGHARAQGYRGLVAPPTFAATLGCGVDFREVLGLAHRNVLVGELSLDLHAPICAGDRVQVQGRVLDLYEKHAAGGMIDYAVIEDEGRGEKGDLLFRARRTWVIRPMSRAGEGAV